jgi:hypothetical protein
MSENGLRSASRQREADAGWDHQRPAAVDGLDDLVRVDAPQIDRRHAEVAVTELALNDVERHALAGEFDRVRVTQLVRRKPALNSGARCEPPELGADGGA